MSYCTLSLERDVWQSIDPMDAIALPFNNFECVEFKKNQQIYCEGNTPLGLYTIKSGRVKVYKLGSDGKEQITHVATVGDMLGYEHLITGSKYATYAEILEEAVLYFIPKQDFLALLKENEELLNNFLVLLCKNILNTEKKMIDIAYKPVRGRLAEALLQLSARFHNKSNDNGGPLISLTRDDLASFIGTAKETAIRMLSEFKKEKLISTNGGDIQILNPGGLKRISNFYR